MRQRELRRTRRSLGEGGQARRSSFAPVSYWRYCLLSEMPKPVADPTPDVDIETRIARRLARLRAERKWSLETLAERTGISRATLSRLERAELSPTAAMLGRLC